MASNVAKSPIFRAVTKRGFAAQTAAKSCPSSGSAEVKTTVLPNKMVVSSVDSNLPVSTVSVHIRAGSRYEQHDNLGITHMLRIAAGLSTNDSTTFGITRNLEEIGANLVCQTDRELVSYTLESTTDNLDTGLKFLGHVVAKQQFRPWELSDNIPRLKYEIASLSPYSKLLDLLHKAAYRTGLGNSLFCPDYLVGSHSSEALQHYVQNLFTTNRTAVVGVGVDHGELTCFAQNLTLESGAGPADEAAKYYGGEQRLDTACNLAHVAVAVEGASLKNTKEALAFAVLKYALGVGTSVKWGSGVSPLSKAVGTAVGNDSFAVSAFNASYSDAGLFGFVASSPGSDIGRVISAAVKQLTSATVSAADIARGKAQLKASILLCQESGYSLAEELGAQSALLGNVTSGAQLAAAVDSITDAEVNAALSKVKSGKPSIASVGKITCVPHVDNLK